MLNTKASLEADVRAEVEAEVLAATELCDAEIALSQGRVDAEVSQECKTVIEEARHRVEAQVAHLSIIHTATLPLILTRISYL